MLVLFPVLAAVVGGGLIALGRWRRQRTPITAGILWLLYAGYETGMQQRWLCRGECNIRVDLLLIHPVLLVALIAATVRLVRPRPHAGGPVT